VIKFQIWDACGQEIYLSLITNFYRCSSLAIMVYAINSKISFENIEMWLREFRTNSNPDAKVILIANKVDLEKQREVTKEEVEIFCKENNILESMESSAKTWFNVQNIFIKAAQVLYGNYFIYQKKVEISGEGNVQKNNNFAEKLDDRKSIDRKNIDNKPVKKQGGCW